MKLARLAVLFFVFALTLTSTGAFAAQQPDDPPPAPVPTPIFTAKKVFISNATGEVVLPPGNPDLNLRRVLRRDEELGALRTCLFTRGR
jgi:hypothetical protein